MEIWGYLGEISHMRGKGTLILVVAWLRRHSSTTQQKKKDCNMSRFGEMCWVIKIATISKNYPSIM